MGAGIGLAGGWLLGLARRRGWIAHSWGRIGILALPLLCLMASEAGGSGESTIRLAVMVTVLASLFLHGLSARPGMEIYARRIASLPSGAPEREVVETGSPDA